MVISLLLEQVQQHENEYVITLINPSTRNFRMALIILHQPYKTGSTDSRQKLYTWLGLLFPGTVARTVTPPRVPEEPDTARRVEDLQGSPLVLEQVMHGLKLLSQVYFVFLNNQCYA